MRFEPANSKYFAQEICSPSFTDSLRLLGCFDENMFAWKKSNIIIKENYEELFEFTMEEILKQKCFSKNQCACILMRLLYEMALDILDKKPDPNDTKMNIILSKQETPIIIYPCIIDSMFQLLKFIQSSELCLFFMSKIYSLLTLERNAQVMCETGLITELMNSAYVDILIDEANILNNLIRFIFEKLSSYHIQAKDLRIFLRLSNPLNSIPLDEIKPKNFNKDKSIPLSRIKSIISISMPKDSNDNFLLNPPFTEFDMSKEGFSCIFIPSIAPISTVSFSNGPTSILAGAIVGNSDVPVTVNGGIGTGERVFPSQSGLSFTSWIYIKNPLESADNHTINILTLYRATQPNLEYSCFKAYINCQDKTLTISTQELPIFSNVNVNTNLDSDHNIRFLINELTKETWHHIVIVLNRALLKNSTVTVYFNGMVKLSKKMSYISSIVGGSYGIANTSPFYINGFIGTPPHYRKHSKLIWKQGPCHLIEEALTSSFVSYIYLLGPNYIGSFQAINYKSSNNQQQQQITEDKLIFGLNARATSLMTLFKMRRVYSKFDCKQIAKIIGLSTHENATPIYVLHNSSGHLCGPSRPLGGILIGNIGARSFVPKQITLTFSDIGGTFLLLGLVANSQSMETLHASIKALVCILRTNRELQLEMYRINGYQILAILLKRKKCHLNSHVLHLLFELVDNLDTKLLNQTSRSIYMNLDLNFEYPSNFRAFKELFVDSIDIWIENDLLKTLLEHFNEIINEPAAQNQSIADVNKVNKKLNLLHLREMNILVRLLSIFREHEIKDEKLSHTIIVLCFRLLNQTNKSKDILYFGQFITSLIDQNQNSLQNNVAESREINLQNSLLKITLQLMSRNTQAINNLMQEELVRVLGFDWFLLFIKYNLNLETITIGLVNIMLLLSNTNLYAKFKEGSLNGMWLKDADLFLENRSGFQLLGFNISTTATQTTNETKNTNHLKNVTKIRRELFTIPGFQHLNWLLSYNIYEPKIYLIIFQTIFGQFRTLTPQTLENIDLFQEISNENLLKVLMVDPKKFKLEKIYCKDLIHTIISMIHSIFCSSDKENPKYLTYTKILINFIKYLYNHNRDFRFYCQTNLEFLNELCQSLLNETINGNENRLVEHPDGKLIFDFILAILINIINATQCTNQLSMNTSSSNNLFANNKPCVIFNNILNNFVNCKKAQTEIMSLFIDCVMASLEFNQNSNSTITGDNFANIILNFRNSYSTIVLLMSTIVDKLWQNCFVEDKKKILDCLIQILKINFPESKLDANIKSLKNLTSQLSEVNFLYKIINRCILYLISRHTESISDRILLFEVLQLIYLNRNLLIVLKCNNDSEFFVCLTHCLLQLFDQEAISLSGNKDRTHWYVQNNKKIDTDEGSLLINSVAKKIWQEIYISRKSLLEETLKISLSLSDSAFGVESSMPDITRFRDILYDNSLKYWSNFIENENQRIKRKPTSLSFDLSMPNTNIISEKLTNINKLNNLTKSAGGFVSKIVGTSGVVGSAISSAVGTTRKEVFRTGSTADSTTTPVNKWTLMSKNDVMYCTSIHESIVKNFINFQLKQKRTMDYNLRKYIFNEWLNNEYEFLTREKAIWGPQYGSKRFDKWMLDMTEGPNRMRKKMLRNDQFYLNYPFRPEMENANYPKFRSPISLDSKDYYKRIHSEKYFLLDKDDDVQSFEYEMEEMFPFNENNDGGKNSVSDNTINKSKSINDDEEIDSELQESDALDILECGDGDLESEKRTGAPPKLEHEDNEMQTILRLLEEGEKISHMFRVARIQGLDSYEGLLLFGKEHFYLIDGFTLLKTKEICDIDSLPPRFVLFYFIDNLIIF